MRPIVVILLTALVLTVEQSARAQNVEPIRRPGENIWVPPEAPEASCTEYWDLPQPLLGVDWRAFPPPGLLEETPERYDAGTSRWLPGIESKLGELEGPRFFTYDESGRISTWTVTSGPFKDPTRNQVRSLYAYDESGNLTDITQQSWDSPSWTNEVRSIYIYTAAGLIDGAEHHVWKDSWNVFARTNCLYGNNGRLEYRIEQTCPLTPVENPNPPCQDTDSTRFEYDASGRITLEYRRTRTFTQPWETPLPVGYTYDEEGRLIEKNDTGTRERFVWVYDDYGRLSEETLFTLGTKRRTRYEYQHAGLLTRVATDTWITSLEAWVEEGEVRYQYNPLLNLGAEFDYEGGSVIWRRRHYEYDGRDNLMSSAQDEWVGSGWRPVFTEEFVYHDAGFLEEYRSDDYVSGRVAGRNRVLYSYAVGTGLSGRNDDLSRRVGLEQNHPNPSSLQTTIAYTLSQPAHVALDVFDLMGRRVETLVSGDQSAGRHRITLETGDLPSGIYFYRLETGGAVKTRRMVVVR